MRLDALYHCPKSCYAFAASMHEIQIRFRTAKDDIDEVVIYYGVKFDWEHKVCASMEKRFTDQYFDYYQYNIVQKDLRIGYYFQVKKETDIVYYTEAGILDEFEDKRAYCLFFQYPTVEEADLFLKPYWYEHAVFYQIFVERFCNGNPNISPKELAKWDEPPTPVSFYGGDLEGIISKLDYLQELGITAIYLTPIFQSISNHKYDTIDYMKIDEHFGDKETLKRLVDGIHKRKMRIILDAVFNHCSDQFEPFVDVKRRGECSEYKDWFFIEQYPIMKNPPNYKVFSTVPYMPKLNVSNPKVQQYLLSVVRYWTTQFHIDGYRLDVADELSHQFIRKLREEIKSCGKDIVLIGEVWHDAMPWLMGDQFNSVMNYGITHQMVNYFAKDKINALEFTNQLVMQLMKYPDSVNQMMFNLLDSHDTERFLYLCDGDVKRLMNAAAFMMGYIGTPCIYYGTEIGMTGGYDPDCRRGFDWRMENWNQTLFNWYHRLIEQKKIQSALQESEIRFESTEDVFIMKRGMGKATIVVVINQTNQVHELPKWLQECNWVDLLHNNCVCDGQILLLRAMYLKKGEKFDEDKR